MILNEMGGKQKNVQSFVNDDLFTDRERIMMDKFLEVA